MGEVGWRLDGRRLFYGWYIVGVGFLANIAAAFSLASTLSVSLNSLTQELGVSRGVFSLLRSGEGLIGAAMAPLIGSLVDQYGGRWMMASGAIVVGVGYLALAIATHDLFLLYAGFFFTA
jgi:nitrate/nitrite transporter NarK